MKRHTVSIIPSTNAYLKVLNAITFSPQWDAIDISTPGNAGRTGIDFELVIVGDLLCARRVRVRGVLHIRRGSGLVAHKVLSVVERRVLIEVLVRVRLTVGEVVDDIHLASTFKNIAGMCMALALRIVVQINDITFPWCELGFGGLHALPGSRGEALVVDIGNVKPTLGENPPRSNVHVTAATSAVGVVKIPGCFFLKKRKKNINGFASKGKNISE